MKKVYILHLSIASIAFMGNWRIEKRAKNLEVASLWEVVSVTAYFEVSLMILLACLILVTIYRLTQKSKSQRKASYLPLMLLVPILVSAPRFTTHRDAWIENNLLYSWNFRFPSENNLLLFGLAAVLMVQIQKLNSKKRQDAEQCSRRHSDQSSTPASA